jgi:deoxyribose-phosphate aldolase
METRLLKCPEDNAIIDKICRALDYAELLGGVWTREIIDEACNDAIKYHFNSVVCHPYNYKYVVDNLRGTGVKALLGFGDNATNTYLAKIDTAVEAMEYGIGEIDMVLSAPLLKLGERELIKSQLKAVCDAAKKYDVGVKLILQVGFLTDAEKREAVEIAYEAGCEFIKIATGIPGSGKCNMHDILLLKDAIKGRMKLKASAGIEYLEDCMAFMEAGADRVASRKSIVRQMEEMGYQPD